MEHSNEHARDGNRDREGSDVKRVIELAGKVRLAQRTAAAFLRHWAVEQAAEEIGLIALRSAMFDMPSGRSDEAMASHEK